MTERKTIVVIGAGVIGLTTALTIQQHLSRSQRILLVAREFPKDTSINYASPWAGAHYRPVPGVSEQITKEASQAQRAYNIFKNLASQDPASGVQIVEGVEHLESPPEEYLDPSSVENVYSHLDGFRVLSSTELPGGVKWGARYETVVINSPVYCAYLLRKFVLRGGETREYTLVHPVEGFRLAGDVAAVVNCSGMGFGDPRSFIIRGQTCLVRNPCATTITRQNADGSWSFCIPRPLDGGTIIGGTKQPHNWDPNPSMETRQQLLANAAKWFPFTPESKGEFDVIRDIVGRRPARDGGMRIEIETVGDGGDGDGKEKAIIPSSAIVHAYGAGGRGFELSWGVAEDVLGLMLREGILDGSGRGLERGSL